MRSAAAPAHPALDQLQSQHAHILDKIEELRALGVRGLVDLPQVIVCGDQSSGKSSVLGAISRVRFPVNGNWVSIEPGSLRTDLEDRNKLRSFDHAALEDSNGLLSLMEEASQHMSIGQPDSPHAGLSDDTLKVEISGPDKLDVTLVDLPGLPGSTSEYHSPEGMEIVDKLIEKYLTNPRSIIMAVITARTGFRLQKVLGMARPFDPERERTLGIITHPDILEANSEEETDYLQLMRNEKPDLQLRWHVLLNWSFETRSLDDDERDIREADFFAKGRWACLPRQNVGIHSLRHRLGHIILQLVIRDLPDIITDARLKITDRVRQLNIQGNARSTIQQQRGFLLAISSRFERITSQALNGMYTDTFFTAPNPEDKLWPDFRRLRAVIRGLNESFAEAMEIGGCRRLIHDLPEDPCLNTTQIASNPYLQGWKPTYITLVALEEGMDEQARRNRGLELPGNVNRFLVASLFRDQSQPWEAVAHQHLIASWEAAKYFVCLVLRQLTEEHTYSLLVSSVLGPGLEDIKGSILSKLSELTAHRKRGHLLPVGNTFLSKIQETRANRQFAELKQTLGAAPVLGTPRTAFSLKDIEQSLPKLQSSSAKFLAADVVDQMQAYYDTSMVTFVDNVATLAIENCLLDPLERIFTSQIVNDMDDGKISTLAAEQSHVPQERVRLTVELITLQSGIRFLNSIAIVHTSQVRRPGFAQQMYIPPRPSTNLHDLEAHAPEAKASPKGSPEPSTNAKTVHTAATTPTAAHSRQSVPFGGFGAMSPFSASTETVSGSAPQVTSGLAFSSPPLSPSGLAFGF